MGHGRFGWYELATPDPRRALDFYGEVVGWTVESRGPDYSIVKAGGYAVGGVKRGFRAEWSGYIEVDDVDAAVARAVALGGAVVELPEDVPGLMRRATLADPQGARFKVFNGPVRAQGGEVPPPPADAPGMFSWSELLCRDEASLFGFYGALFGWTKAWSFSLGPMGTYSVIGHEGRDIGGLMNKAAHVVDPFWGYYIQVESISAAVLRLKALGGSIYMPPHEVPGHRWSVPGHDAQGALIALLSARA